MRRYGRNIPEGGPSQCGGLGMGQAWWGGEETGGQGGWSRVRQGERGGHGGRDGLGLGTCDPRHYTMIPLKSLRSESSSQTCVLLSDARRARGWIPAHFTFFKNILFILTGLSDSQRKTQLPIPSLFCLSPIPPSGLDQGRNCHLRSWQIKPYVFFNLTVTQTPNLQIKGKPGLGDD